MKRKLDKKNKIYIAVLSIFVIVVLIIVLSFIFYKIRETNIKYEIDSGSYAYNTAGELVNALEDTYAKKNLLGKYQAVIDKEKVNLGSNAVIFNERLREVKLLGTFYEITKNGEVNKLKGETEINSTAVSRVFKIADRKYLVVSSSVRSEDSSLNASDYLLIDIDKAGNAYLYNNKINIKTFSDLKIITEGFTFNVNEEKLLIEDEVIDLAKINGSTNEYKKEETPDSENDVKNDDDGTDAGNAGAQQGNNIYQEPEKRVETITETVTVDKYVARRTTIMSLETTTSEIKINYIVYDPLTEYQEIYVNVSSNGNFINKYLLSEALTSHTISDLKANTNYRLDFYYSYADASGNVQNILFDTAMTKTKNVNASIAIEKVSQNVVRYVLKVEGGYKLDSAKVVMYIDGEEITSDSVNTANAASKDGYKGSITFDGTGEFVTLKLTDCFYNGAPIDIDATYKYKL